MTKLNDITMLDEKTYNDLIVYKEKRLDVFLTTDGTINNVVIKPMKKWLLDRGYRTTLKAIGEWFDD
jgi:hypothetical protein